MLKREGKQNLIIENKMYERNVNVDEIKKFLRDVNEQKTNGIMMSQYSGIVSKGNFFIEIHDGKVLIYMHNVEYSPEKIRLAIDAIDILSAKIEELSNVEDINGCVIRKDTLDKINEQFQIFINQKEIVIMTLKETHKKLLTQIEDLKIPDLSLYLNEKYASMQNQTFSCEVCSLPFQNKRSLAAHKKIHKSNGDILVVNT
jgi:stress-induced morphogen